MSIFFNLSFELYAISLLIFMKRLTVLMKLIFCLASHHSKKHYNLCEHGSFFEGSIAAHGPQWIPAFLSKPQSVFCSLIPLIQRCVLCPFHAMILLEFHYNHIEKLTSFFINKLYLSPLF